MLFDSFGWVGGGCINSIVTQSPIPWILGFDSLNLDLGIDNLFLVATPKSDHKCWWGEA